VSSDEERDEEDWRWSMERQSEGLMVHTRCASDGKARTRPVGVRAREAVSSMNGSQELSGSIQTSLTLHGTFLPDTVYSLLGFAPSFL